MERSPPGAAPRCDRDEPEGALELGGAVWPPKLAPTNKKKSMNALLTDKLSLREIPFLASRTLAYGQRHQRKIV